jgi:hypothetical protein
VLDSEKPLPSPLTGKFIPSGIVARNETWPSWASPESGNGILVGLVARAAVPIYRTILAVDGKATRAFTGTLDPGTGHARAAKRSRKRELPYRSRDTLEIGTPAVAVTISRMGQVPAVPASPVPQETGAADHYSPGSI